MKVFDLGAYRDLLNDWEEVRRRILQGKIQAWSVSVRDDLGREAIYLGGSFKTDAKAATKAGMRASWEMTKKQDEEEAAEAAPVKKCKV